MDFRVWLARLRTRMARLKASLMMNPETLSARAAGRQDHWPALTTALRVRTMFCDIEL